MQDFLTLILIPVLVIVIGLIIEYWVIKPIRKANEIAIPSSQSLSRDWATAIKRAVQQFKRQQTDYAWKRWLLGNARVTIEGWNIDKAVATLTLAVSTEETSAENPAPGVTIIGPVWRVSAKYQLMIDRTGDILKMNSIPVDTTRSNGSLISHQRDLPEITAIIKNLKTPVVENVDEEVKVIIEFEVENSGRAGKICPYIEFQVVTARGDGKYTPKIFKSEPKSYDIPALCTQPFRCEFLFPLPDLPLVKPPHKVKVELYPYPDVRSKS